jgi:hypothetical protein
MLVTILHIEGGILEIYFLISSSAERKARDKCIS